MTSPAVQGSTGLRYRPIIALGHGGMADVLLSVGRGPSGFNKLVVLKTMRKELVTDEDLRQMFLAEARLSARLNHPNVVQVYEVVDTALPCIIMEYLEGQPMSALYHEAGDRFSIPLQLKVISETLAGLHYSHELKDYDGTPLNIVHRDVSPQNIFITYDGVVKVLDFGIAKASDATGHTRTGVVKGKITYMPREQLLSEQTDRRADIYAVGCIMWQTAAGQKLWQGMQEGDVIRALIEGKIPPPSSVRPVDPKLEAIVMKALAPDADGRYSTAEEFRLAVDNYLNETSPKTSMREVGELVASVFTEQHETRKRQIHVALTAPRSEPPPVIPEGIESIISSGTGISVQSKILEQKRELVWTIVIAVGAALLALGGMIAFLAWRGSRDDRTPQVVANTAPSQPDQIQVQLRAFPAGAQLSVDGSPLSGNPATLTVPSDTRDHEIRATLAGHEPYSKVVRFDRDLSLEIMLQALPAPEPSIAPQTKPVGAGRYVPRAPAAAAPAGKKPDPKAANCDPPFYFEGGIKVYKPGCL